MKYKNIKEATKAWVSEFSAIPYTLIEKAYLRDGVEGITEVTPLSKLDRVYHFEKGEYGYIIGMPEDGKYIIDLDSDEKIEAERDDIEIDQDSILPIWGTMWMFSDPCDNWWIKEEENKQKMANCGFRIYEIEEGIIFGIDGAGYDFYDSHWIPLYKQRGLHWHETKEKKTTK